MELIWAICNLIIILFGLLVEGLVVVFFVVKASNGKTKSKLVNMIYEIIFEIASDF